MSTRTEGWTGFQSGAEHSGTSSSDMSHHESAASEVANRMKKYAELFAFVEHWYYIISNHRSTEYEHKARKSKS